MALLAACNTKFDDVLFSLVSHPQEPKERAYEIDVWMKSLLNKELSADKPLNAALDAKGPEISLNDS